jgi:hypothetical protein
MAGGVAEGRALSTLTAPSAKEAGGDARAFKGRGIARRSDIHEGVSVKTGARRARDFPDIPSASPAAAERHETLCGCPLHTGGVAVRPVRPRAAAGVPPPVLTWVLSDRACFVHPGEPGPGLLDRGALLLPARVASQHGRQHAHQVGRGGHQRDLLPPRVLPRKARRAAARGTRLLRCG